MTRRALADGALLGLAFTSCLLAAVCLLTFDVAGVALGIIGARCAWRWRRDLRTTTTGRHARVGHRAVCDCHPGRDWPRDSEFYAAHPIPMPDAFVRSALAALPLTAHKALLDAPTDPPPTWPADPAMLDDPVFRRNKATLEAENALAMRVDPAQAARYVAEHVARTETDHARTGKPAPPDPGHRRWQV